MGEFTQKRLVRKLDLERFLATVAVQPTPKAQLEQYTISPAVAANMLYLAAYTNNDIAGKRVLDLGCGTGRLALGAAYLDADSVVGVDIDRCAIQTARTNLHNVGCAGTVALVLADIAAVTGHFDTVLQNPPFGVQTREADRAFLVKALEVGDAVYSLHNHPTLDERLIGRLRAGEGVLRVEPAPFLERFVAKQGAVVVAVYAMLMSIPRMFEFHTKLRHDFVVDLYVLKKALR